MTNIEASADHSLTIPRVMDVDPDAMLTGQKFTDDFMACYGPDGKLIFIFDSRTAIDLYPPAGQPDEPITEADLANCRISSLDDEDCATVVYFIGGETGGIKIGRTVNLQSRFKAIQSCSPIPLKVLATRKGEEIEKLYHRHFAAHRLHGEWFAPHPDILAEIERLSHPKEQ